MFRRSGADIHSDLFISIAQAVLGGTATAQGLHDTIRVVVSGGEAVGTPQENTSSELPVWFQIPSGCQADQVIQLQGKGVRRMNSYSYGDHYVHIKVRVPVYDTHTHTCPKQHLSFTKLCCRYRRGCVCILQ